MERLLQDVGGSLHSPNEDMDAHRVIADMNELDERIRSREQSDLINSERDILHQQAIMSQYNNPMTYLTPILIASLVIVSVLVVVCMCGGGFCWYVRFNKKEEERERDVEQQRMIHPNNHNNSYSAAIYAENNYLVEQRKANSDSFATSSVRSSSRSTSRRPHDSDKGRSKDTDGSDSSDESTKLKQPPVEPSAPTPSRFNSFAAGPKSTRIPEYSDDSSDPGMVPPAGSHQQPKAAWGRSPQ